MYLGKGEPLMGFWPYFRHAHESVGVLPSPTPLGRGPLTSASGTVTTRLFADRLLPVPVAAAGDVDGGAGDTGDPGQSADDETTPAAPALLSPPDTIGEDAAAPSLHSPSICPASPREEESARARGVIGWSGDSRQDNGRDGARQVCRSSSRPDPNPMSPAAPRQLILRGI